MEKIIQKTENSSPNLEFYKTITDKGDLYKGYNNFNSEPFDVFKMETKETKDQNFYGGYLATSNRETKNIDSHCLFCRHS